MIMGILFSLMVLLLLVLAIISIVSLFLFVHALIFHKPYNWLFQNRRIINACFAAIMSFNLYIMMSPGQTMDIGIFKFGLFIAIAASICGSFLKEEKFYNFITLLSGVSFCAIVTFVLYIRSGDLGVEGDTATFLLLLSSPLLVLSTPIIQKFLTNRCQETRRDG